MGTYLHTNRHMGRHLSLRDGPRSECTVEGPMSCYRFAIKLVLIEAFPVRLSSRDGMSLFR